MLARPPAARRPHEHERGPAHGSPGLARFRLGSKGRRRRRRAEAGALGFKIGLAVLLCVARAGRRCAATGLVGERGKHLVGVFLALAFGHMVPEARRRTAAKTAACRWTLGGYLLIWAVERLANGAEAPSSICRPRASRPWPAAPSRGSADERQRGNVVRCLSVLLHARTMALAVARSKSAAAVAGIAHAAMKSALVLRCAGGA